MRLRRFGSVTAMLVLVAVANAQRPNEKTPTRIIQENRIDQFQGSAPLDTSLNHVEIFHPGFKQYVFQDLGNIGTPAQSLIFNPHRNVGFEYAQNPFSLYFKNPNQTKYINTKAPYSELFYSQGSKELLVLDVKHAQNINPRWNVGLDLNRITSQGFQRRQITSLYHYQFFTSYISKNLRYELLANATWNRGIVENNGGVSSDSVYEALTGATKTVQGKLDGAATRFKNRSAYVKQYYRFGQSAFVYKEKDSTYLFEPKLQLAHTLHAEEMSYIFVNDGNTDTALLPNQFYDVGNKTFDSTYLGKLSNRIQLQHHTTGYISNFLGIKDSSNLLIEGGIRHELIQVAQIPFVRRFDNFIIEGKVKQTSLIHHQTTFEIEASRVLAGYNAGDYRYHVGYRIFTAPLSIGLQLETQQYRPDFATQLFRSNAFIWSNNLKPVSSERIGIHLATQRFRNNFSLQFNNFFLTNWVYMQSDATPAQLNKQANLLQVQLSKKFQLWKFHFEHYLFYQKSSVDEIRLPEVSGMIRYSFQSKFKGLTSFQIGVDVFYQQAYFANAYNPATRYFHLQNQVRIGDYPLIDPFVAAQVKRMNFFLKYEHANENLIQGKPYLTPHYPVSQASFRFGMRWRFYD